MLGILVELIDEPRHEVEGHISPRPEHWRSMGQLVAKVRKLSKELTIAEIALRQRGFCLSEDHIKLQWYRPKDLDQAVTEAIAKAHKERDAELKKFDLAILSVWTAKDAEKAGKIVEGLL